MPNKGSTLAFYLKETAAPTLFLNASPQPSKLLFLSFEAPQSGEDVRRMVLERQAGLREQGAYEANILAPSGRHIDRPRNTRDHYIMRSSYGGILSAASDGLANEDLYNPQRLDSTMTDAQTNQVTEQERLRHIASQANEVLSDKLSKVNVETARSGELPDIPNKHFRSHADGTQVRSAISPMRASGIATSPASEQPRLSKATARAGLTAESHSQHGSYNQGVINFTRISGAAPVTPTRDTAETPAPRQSVRLHGPGTPLIARDANGSIAPRTKDLNVSEGRDPRDGKVTATLQNKEFVQARPESKPTSNGAKPQKSKISERLEDRGGKTLK